MTSNVRKDLHVKNDIKCKEWFIRKERFTCKEWYKLKNDIHLEYSLYKYAAFVKQLDTINFGYLLINTM